MDYGSAQHCIVPVCIHCSTVQQSCLGECFRASPSSVMSRPAPDSFVILASVKASQALVSTRTIRDSAVGSRPSTTHHDRHPISHDQPNFFWLHGQQRKLYHKTKSRRRKNCCYGFTANVTYIYTIKLFREGFKKKV